MKLVLSPPTLPTSFAPWRWIAGLPCRFASARRGRRCPAGAQTGAVVAVRRLRCVPLRLQAQGRSPGTQQSAGTVACPGSLRRPGVASQNSLRSLRSLRSDNCDESVYEARCARRPRGCAPRRPTHRPRRAAPAALQRLRFAWEATPLQRRARTGRAAPLGRREAQGSWPRAQRESWSDSARLFERRERSERSEFRAGATRPSIAGQSARSDDRSSEAQRPVRERLCRPGLCTRSATRFMRRGSHDARWSN